MKVIGWRYFVGLPHGCWHICRLGSKSQALGKALFLPSKGRKEHFSALPQVPNFGQQHQVYAWTNLVCLLFFLCLLLFHCLPEHTIESNMSDSSEKRAHQTLDQSSMINLNSSWTSYKGKYANWSHIAEFRIGCNPTRQWSSRAHSDMLLEQGLVHSTFSTRVSAAVAVRWHLYADRSVISGQSFSLKIWLQTCGKHTPLPSPS